MKISSPVLGLLLSALAYLFFTGFDSLTKLAANHGMPVLQVMSFELLWGAFFLTVWTAIEQRKNLKKAFRVQKKHLHLARGLLNGVSNVMFFIGFLHMPLAEFYVILFMIPIWVAIIAALFLGEKSSRSLIFVIIVSFIGVLIALRPGEGLSPWTLLVLCGTFTNATALVVLRRMTKTESNHAAAISVCLIMGLVGLIPALVMFKTPDLYSILCMAGGGVCFAVAQRFLIKGCELVAVPLAGATQFLQLIYGTVVGYLVFNDKLSVWIFVGGAIVIAANLFMILSENKRGVSSLLGPKG
jgi:drug/metabolite transporter (DMT)-like permease